jgi:hypothetical protein
MSYFIFMFQCSRPPKPPPGQEGRGSYVWVPDTVRDEQSDDAFATKQCGSEDFVDDVADNDNNGSANTDKEYEDEYAADYIGDDNVSESGGVVVEDTENMGPIA